MGSSPLTRGKQCRPPPPHRSTRLIPAHAGKTDPGNRPHHRSGAHPRSRGENLSCGTRTWTGVGSSPLTRGKLHRCSQARSLGWLIPAHAGKTPEMVCCPHRTTAHPRSRGENKASRGRSWARIGSSPLTRGKQPWGRGRALSARLIPAHAGKTKTVPGLYGQTAAHPRSRGENRRRCEATLTTTGSSPLTRGKHFLTCAFTAQIDQILETLELAASSGSYSIWVACATDAPQDQVQSIGLVLPSSRGAS